MVFAHPVQLQARFDHVNGLQAARLHDTAHGPCMGATGSMQADGCKMAACVCVSVSRWRRSLPAAAPCDCWVARSDGAGTNAP